MNDFYREVGRLMRRTRRATGFTQIDVASDLGISVMTVGNMERGGRRGSHVSLATFCALCELYGVSPGHLLRTVAM